MDAKWIRNYGRDASVSECYFPYFLNQLNRPAPLVPVSGWRPRNTQARIARFVGGAEAESNGRVGDREIRPAAGLAHLGFPNERVPIVFVEPLCERTWLCRKLCPRGFARTKSNLSLRSSRCGQKRALRLKARCLRLRKFFRKIVRPTFRRKPRERSAKG